MKKLSVLFIAAALVLFLTLPAAAIEHQFGGYWRVRAFTNNNFSGEDSTEGSDLTQTDSRTRLYYTAKFSDNFKFVNKWEFDWVYGLNDLGDIGADGGSDANFTGMEIKNSYVDFNLGPTNFKIGIQGYAMGRGFIFDDDFSGAILTYKGEGWDLPVIWIKGHEGGKGQDQNDQDLDYYAINPSFKVGDLKVNPFFLLVYSDNGRSFSATSSFDDVNIYYLGGNVDYKVAGWNLWGTAIYNGGDADLVATGTSQDFKGYLFGLGANGAAGPFGLRGQFFWASGDDNTADNDTDAFTPPRGRSYYWSEIMGYGIFDNQLSANSPGDGISNIWAINGGADYSLTESLKLSLDLWYAELVEKLTATGDETLGTEVDLKATYKVIEGLNLDMVAAYLFRGDGTYKGTGEADPWELGARLSLSF